MEVTHLDHKSTHAIIGGHAPQSFEVKANAEFYEMLSSTLYPNKKLAVVREVLANSWDAHLMVGKSDTPVEVTINDKEMVFRDFGPGISHEQIIPIYCTYGGSTKSHDGNQTGGFGLGSKAPFAYTKHFTVVSCHDGKRTIYAASRGSSETEGRPDFRAMVADIPTTETGITVTIPLIKPEDRKDFEELVKDLAYLGGMNVKLNGKKLTAVPYHETNLPFVLIGHNNIGRHHGRKAGLYLRYGAVVYPVDTNDPRIDGALKADNFITNLMRVYSVVLLAQPNAIGVAPSRETLSYTDKTVETVIGLLNQSEDVFVRDRERMSKMAITAIGNAMKRKNNNVLETYARIVGGEGNIYEHVQRIVGYVSRMESIDFVVDHKRILELAVLNALGHGQRDTIKRALNKMSPSDLIFQMKDMVRKRWRGWKRYFNQIEASARGKKGVYESSLDYDLTRRFGRIQSAISGQFQVNFAFGRFSWDEFIEEEADRFGDRIRRDLLDGNFTGKPNDLMRAVPVVFAPSRAAAMRFKKAKGLPSEKSQKPVVIALTRKSSDVDGAMTQLQKFGFEVYDARDHVVRRDKPELSEELYLVPSTDNPAELRKWDETSDVKFYCYGTVQERRGQKYVGTHLRHSSLDWIRKHVGDCVVALNAADARMLGKKGLRNVNEILAEEILSLAQTEAGAAALLTRTRIVRDRAPVLYDLGVMRKDDGRMIDALFEPMGLSVAARDTLDARSKGLITLIHDHFDGIGIESTDKFGTQHVINAMKEARECLFTRYEKALRVLDSEEFSSFYKRLESYYSNWLNSAVMFAAISAAFQAAAVQLALKPNN